MKQRGLFEESKFNIIKDIGELDEKMDELIEFCERKVHKGKEMEKLEEEREREVLRHQNEKEFLDKERERYLGSKSELDAALSSLSKLLQSLNCKGEIVQKK